MKELVFVCVRFLIRSDSVGNSHFENGSESKKIPTNGLIDSITCWKSHPFWGDKEHLDVSSISSEGESLPFEILENNLLKMDDVIYPLEIAYMKSVGIKWLCLEGLMDADSLLKLNNYAISKGFALNIGTPERWLKFNKNGNKTRYTHRDFTFKYTKKNATLSK